MHLILALGPDVFNESNKPMVYLNLVMSKIFLFLKLNKQAMQTNIKIFNGVVNKVMSNKLSRKPFHTYMREKSVKYLKGIKNEFNHFISDHLVAVYDDLIESECSRSIESYCYSHGIKIESDELGEKFVHVSLGAYPLK